MSKLLLLACLVATVAAYDWDSCGKHAKHRRTNNQKPPRVERETASQEHAAGCTPGRKDPMQDAAAQGHKQERTRGRCGVSERQAQMAWASPNAIAQVEDQVAQLEKEMREKTHALIQMYKAEAEEKEEELKVSLAADHEAQQRMRMAEDMATQAKKTASEAQRAAEAAALEAKERADVAQRAKGAVDTITHKMQTAVHTVESTTVRVGRSSEHHERQAKTLQESAIASDNAAPLGSAASQEPQDWATKQENSPSWFAKLMSILVPLCALLLALYVGSMMKRIVNPKDYAR